MKVALLLKKLGINSTLLHSFGVDRRGALAQGPVRCPVG